MTDENIYINGPTPLVSVELKYPHQWYVNDCHSHFDFDPLAVFSLNNPSNKVN